MKNEWLNEVEIRFNSMTYEAIGQEPGNVCIQLTPPLALLRPKGCAWLQDLHFVG